jgi:hypothetical protein
MAYTVTVGTGIPRRTYESGDYLKLHDGHLEILDNQKKSVAVFAPGHWQTVEREGSSK